MVKPKEMKYGSNKNFNQGKVSLYPSFPRDRETHITVADSFSTGVVPAMTQSDLQKVVDFVRKQGWTIT